MKNTKIYLFLSIAVIISLAISSCGKYEDGPGFSLLSKTARMTNTWELKSVDGETIPAGEAVLDLKKDGSFSINEDGFIEHAIEKPAIPKSNNALVGLYKIKESEILFECFQQLFNDNIKSQGEYNLTDALECMIKKGVQFKSFKVKHWYDCGKKESLLETNAVLLKKSGGISVNPNLYTNSIIIPPVSIADDCVIENSIIGPHVTIGNNTNIKSSIVRDSIIGSYTSLDEVVLDNSLIGSDAAVKGLSRSLNIGDNTEIDFG